MYKLPIIAISTALFVTSCASRYTELPADPGTQPNPETLVKEMSDRLRAAKQYSFTTSNTIPQEMAKAHHQEAQNDVVISVSRPNKLIAKISQKGTLSREMTYDGNTFTVVDHINHFYSNVKHSGSLDTAVAQMTQVYGFQPPLTEFLISNPYQDIKHRVQSFSYLGKGEVKEAQGKVLCHRIGLHGKYADSELWLGVEDKLPRRLKATRSNSEGKDLLVDVHFLEWNLNPQLSHTLFNYQAPAGTEKIPMISVSEANANAHSS